MKKIIISTVLTVSFAFVPSHGMQFFNRIRNGANRSYQRVVRPNVVRNVFFRNVQPRSSQISQLPRFNQSSRFRNFFRVNPTSWFPRINISGRLSAFAGRVRSLLLTAVPSAFASSIFTLSASDEDDDEDSEEDTDNEGLSGKEKKLLLEGLENQDDSAKELIEKIFRETKDSELIKDVFTKLLKSDWGFRVLKGLVYNEQINEQMLKAQIDITIENFTAICNELYGFNFIDFLMYKANVMYEIEGNNQVFQRFIDAIAKDFTVFCNNSKGRGFLSKFFYEYLQCRSLNLEGLIDEVEKNFISLCDNDDGCFFLAVLAEKINLKDKKAAQGLISLTIKNTTFFCGNTENAIEFLKNIMNSMTFKEVLEMFIGGGLIAKEGYSSLFYDFVKDHPCNKDIKSTLLNLYKEDKYKNDVDMILKVLSYIETCSDSNDFQMESSQSINHMKGNLKNIMARGKNGFQVRDRAKPVGIMKNFAFRRMINKVLQKEKELKADYYTFIHGQMRCYTLPQKWFTKLWSIRNEHPCEDFIFAHVEKPIEEDQLVDEIEKRKKILFCGTPDLQDHKFVQFLNHGLFSYALNGHENALEFVYENINCNRCFDEDNINVSLENAFEHLDYKHIYQKYKKELEEIENEYNQLSRYGDLLMFAVPKDKINNCVYLAKPGGLPHEVEIKGVGKTCDVKLIMETLRNEPEKISDDDEILFVLSQTWDKDGGLNPESGNKVFAFNTVEPEKMAEFNKKEHKLWEKIKKDIEDEIAGNKNKE